MKQIALLLLVATLGCATQPVNVKRLTDEVFAPRGAVPVLNEFPKIEHVRIAELSVSYRDDAMFMLWEKARDLGADALVLVLESAEERALRQTRDALARTRTVTTSVIRAVAIRY